MKPHQNKEKTPNTPTDHQQPSKLARKSLSPLTNPSPNFSQSEIDWLLERTKDFNETLSPLTNPQPNFSQSEIDEILNRTSNFVIRKLFFS